MNALALGHTGSTSRHAVEGAVEQLIADVISGAGASGGSIYLEGPPGIGKSHLVATALERVDGAAMVLRARGDQRRRNQAFGLVIQLVGPPPPDVHPTEFVLDRIDELCGAQPVVVWVDDVHNADEATLTALRRVVWSARALPLAVFISARNYPVREGLVLLADQVQSVLQLPPMDSVMVEGIVFDRFGRWPGPALRRALDGAGGNPLFVVEILRSLDEADFLVRDGDNIEAKAGSLPRLDRLQGVVRDHMEQLDEASRDALGTLAVCGTSTAVGTLAHVMFADSTDLEGPLGRAEAAGLIRLSEDGRVDFVHDVYRDVAYEALPDALRRVTHRRVSQVAEADGAAPVFVAEHRLRGLSAGDHDDSVLNELRIAAAQTEQYAPEVAAGLLGLVDDAAGGEGDDHVLLARVENLFLSGRGRAVEGLIRDRIAGVVDPSVAARMQAVLIRQLVNRAEVDGAVAAIDQTTRIPGLPVPVLSGLLATRAWTNLLDGQFLGHEEIDLLVADAEASDSINALRTLRLIQGCQAFLSGAPSAAMTLLERGPTAEEGPEPEGLALVFHAWASLIKLGPDHALNEVQSARQNSPETVRWVGPFLGSLAGRASLVAGEWDDAIAELDTAVELAEEVGTGWLSTYVGSRAYIDAHRGDTAGARARLEAFRHRRLPVQFGLDYPGFSELAILEAEGAHTAAATLARSLWSAARNRPGRGPVEYAVDVMRVALMTMQERLSTQVVNDLTDEILDARNGRRGLEPVVRLDGLADLVQGMAGSDPDRIANAAELFATQGWRWHRTQALEELACAAATVGDRARAIEARDEAVSAYEGMRARVDRDRLLARTRALGLRRGSRQAQRTTDHGWGSLTATELRVVVLIREGLTNREIGSRLFISPRTVQTHVSHILTKTGLRSRVEVAAATTAP